MLGKNRVGRSGNVFFILTFYALQNRVGRHFKLFFALQNRVGKDFVLFFKPKSIEVFGLTTKLHRVDAKNIQLMDGQIERNLAE